MSVCGVDDQQVDAGLDQRLRLGDHIAVDADRGADPQPSFAVDGRRVDARADRPGTGQHPGQGAVGAGQHRDVDRSVLEKVEDLFADRCPPGR